MTAPVEFAIPAPYDASFTHGELAIGSSAAVVAGLTTYYLARWLPLPSGIYTLTAVTDDAATWWLDDGVTFLADTRIGDGVVSYEIFIPEGARRLDVILQNMSVGTSLCYLAFNLSRDGAVVFTSSAEDWVIDDARIPDADLGPAPDLRFILPVWSIFPNWATPITERLEWLTDIMESEKSDEQRRSLRLEPRRSLEMSFLRQGPTRTRMDNFITAVGEDKIVVPVFIEQFKMKVDTPIGATSVTLPPFSLDARDFRDEDVCMFSLGVPGQYELVQIDSLNNTTGVITFKDATLTAWPAGSRIIPMRIARLLDTPAITGRTDNVGTATLRFSFDESEQAVAPAWLDGLHVWPFKIDYSANIETNYNRLTFVLDNQIASPTVFDYGRLARIGMNTACKFFGRSNVKALRQFLGAVRGRSQRFWMPTFMQDLVPAANIAGDVFVAEETGFVELFTSPQLVRMYLAVEFYDGTPTIYRRITGVTQLGDTEVYGLDSSWPEIQLSNVRRVGFMMPTRFDQDGFELTHHTDDAAAVAVNFVTMTVDSIEGMPALTEE